MCPYHQSVVLNSKSELLAYRDCIEGEHVIDTSWFVLDPHVATYYKRYHPSYSPLPEFDSNCNEFNDRTDQMVFVYPKESSTLFLPKNIDGLKERCVIKASHKDSKSKVYWHINGQYEKMTEDIHEISLDLTAGEYLITIQDESGLKKSRHVEIIEGE